MEITIKGDAKEIAALVLEIQERQGKAVQTAESWQTMLNDPDSLEKIKGAIQASFDSEDLNRRAYK